MKPLHQWSTLHLVLAVAAVVVAIVLVLQFAESLFATDEPVHQDSTADAPAPIEPLDAEIYIEGGDTVVVETANRQRTRIVLSGDAEAAEAMAQCIREEIDRLSKESPSDERSRETVVLFGLRIEGHGSDPRVHRAVEKCALGDLDDVPEIPESPEPPGSN